MAANANMAQAVAEAVRRDPALIRADVPVPVCGGQVRIETEPDGGKL